MFVPLVLALRQKGEIRLIAAQQQRAAALRRQRRCPFAQNGGDSDTLYGT